MRPETPILVVEDDSDLRFALVELLDDDGYRTSVAANGAEALSRLRSGDTPGVILLDLVMPVMDGWTFRARQLEQRAWREIPIVVMSGIGDHTDAEALGADAYVAKPVLATRLLDVVGSLTGLSGCASCGVIGHHLAQGPVAFCTECRMVSADPSDDPHRDTGGGD